MVTSEINERVQVLERSPEKLNATAIKQVSDILKEAESGQTKSWSYSIPSAGVRYYSYR